MGGRIRAFDWASTPLGPRSGWPEYLRIMVDICLSSTLPGAICAGPDLTTIYNDALIARFGPKHPAVLGRPAREVWSEFWPTIGPIVDQVLATGKGTQLTDFHFTCDRGDGPKETTFNAALNAIREPLGRTVGISCIGIDTTEQKRSERGLRESEQRLRMALEVGELGICDTDDSTDSQSWSDQLYRILGYAPGEVTPGYEAWARRIHPDDLWKADEARSLLRQQEADYSVEYRLQLPDGGIRWCSTRWRSLSDAAGKRRVLGVVQDITERRQWEETQQILIAELQHRTRNLLAVVRSLSAQTLRASDTLDMFERDFNSRLSALSRVQGLLSHAGGEFVRLRDLVLGELAAHGVAPDGKRIVVTGRDVRLSSKAVQVLTLALHELATNAIKHGALSQPGARLHVSWSTSGTGAGRLVTIRWSEAEVLLAPDVSTRRGFGRELIERAIPYDLGARTSFGFSADGLQCEIRLPLRRSPDE